MNGERIDVETNINHHDPNTHNMKSTVDDSKGKDEDGKNGTEHIEPANSSSTSQENPRKGKTRIIKLSRLGVKTNQRKRADISVLVNMVVEGVKMKQIAKEYPEEYAKWNKRLRILRDDMTEHRSTKPYVSWVWGKSEVERTNYVLEKHNDVYIKDNTRWWDGYDYEEAILVKEFKGKWMHSTLLHLLDRYPFQAEIRGGYVKITSPYIYITCEIRPEQLFSSLSSNQLNQILRRIDIVIHIVKSGKKTPEEEVAH
jgi:hypothetical protein